MKLKMQSPGDVLEEIIANAKGIYGSTASVQVDQAELAVESNAERNSRAR
jgi:hypothetical protein